VQNIIINFKIFILLLFFIGCSATPSFEQRELLMLSLLEENRYKKSIFYTKYFDIFSVSSIGDCKNNQITIYIEGDGLSWITKNILSKNPTPSNPIALKLMMQDNSKCKIYLSRPCQYTNIEKCENKFWNEARFSNDVIKAYIEILDSIKRDYKNSSFKLIGYSGGGAIATILSAKREDITFLITVAGNLDIEKWINTHNISKLNESLNPADFTKNLENLHQIHLIADDDKNISIDIFLSFKNRFENSKNVKHKIFNDFTHSKGWVENWNNIINN